MHQTTRKHYLILPSYQIRLVGFLILVLFLGSILHGFFLYRLTAKSIEEGFFSAHNRLRSTWEILKPAVIVTNGLSFFLVSLGFLLITILLSHRLIGPMFKIAGRLRELAKGRLDLPPVQLRRGDEGQLLSEALNHLQTEMQGRFRTLSDLRRRISGGATPPMEEIRFALDTALKDLSVPPIPEDRGEAENHR